MSALPPPTKPQSLRRKRPLKRGASYTLLEDVHFPYLYVAYKRGVFSHLGEMPDGLSPSEFKKYMLAAAGRVLEAGGELFVFIAKTPYGEMPVGLVVAHIMDIRLEPHVFWFHEASARNRLECALKWILDMKSKYALFIWCKEPDWKFFNHLGKYGAVRCVGKYRNFPHLNADAFLFQGVT